MGAWDALLDTKIKNHHRVGPRIIATNIKNGIMGHTILAKIIIEQWGREFFPKFKRKIGVL